jgi:hypothetical protein
VCVDARGALVTDSDDPIRIVAFLATAHSPPATAVIKAVSSVLWRVAKDTFASRFTRHYVTRH